MELFSFLTFIFLAFFGGNNNNECLCFDVTDINKIEVERPVSIQLDQNSACWNDNMVLVKKTKSGTEIIPYQKDADDKKKIWFQHSSSNQVQTQYCFSQNEKQGKTTVFSSKKDKGDLQLNHGNRSLIGYRYGITPAPEGVNPLYQKSGYIHPVISPKGDTLTRIQPPDHYHHYGIWGPWTRTRIEDVGVDFWNLKDAQGTVLFKSFNHIEAGGIYAGFSAHQEHFNLTQKPKQVALNENLKVKVWKNQNPNHYFIDYTTQFTTPLENGILFEAYRYGGGLGFRFKEQWDKNNCEVITSEGKDRKGADGTSARWCIVYGDSSDGKGKTGVLFMSHPENQSHPEPMRVWPLDANKGRGDMFFEFCPIRHQEWKINPQNTYALNYRMLVFDGTITPEEAENHWKAFAFPPKINITNN